MAYERLIVTVIPDRDKQSVSGWRSPVTIVNMAEERRIVQRRKIYSSCQVECGDRMASGRVIDASKNGIAVLLPEAGDLVKGDTRIHISPAHQPVDEFLETIVLRTRLMDLQKKSKGHRLGLKVEKVENGESDWMKLATSSSSTASVK